MRIEDLKRCRQRCGHVAEQWIKAIDRFTLLYNRARQAAITKELMEIIGGAEALKE